MAAWGRRAAELGEVLAREEDLGPCIEALAALVLQAGGPLGARSAVGWLRRGGPGRTGARIALCSRCRFSPCGCRHGDVVVSVLAGGGLRCFWRTSCSAWRTCSTPGARRIT